MDLDFVPSSLDFVPSGLEFVPGAAALLCPPPHLERRQSGTRVDASRDDEEPLALVEPARASVRFVDVEFDDARRTALGLVEKRRGQPRAALGRRDAELVEIAGLRIDGHEAGGLFALKPDDDDGAVDAKRA